MADRIQIIAVVGPTASGKSALAVELARRYNGEVVSCDSMQIYRDMSIGTAKPTAAEMGGIPHHLIDCIDPKQPFSCADYEREANRIIRDINARGKRPVICGGTGLYLDALLRGSSFDETAASDETLRQELFDIAATQGNETLHGMLAQVDPESAAAIHPNNVKRVVRAIEIYRTTGKTKSELDRLSRTFEPRYDAAVIGLRFTDRSRLYERIDRRVDAMMRSGLLEETRKLLADGVFETNATAAQAIGYKELLGYIRGDMSLEDAVASLKQATRRYAKRQMTWFSARPYVRWLDLDRDGRTLDLDGIVRECEAALNL